MSEGKKFVIRCRAIILHEGKLLVVRHRPSAKFVALPGGHLEWGEGVKECFSREIVEELGIEPEIGRLLYINTFQDGEDIQPFEFFFEVKNGRDYAQAEKLVGTHSHEISEILWITPDQETDLLPKALAVDFKAGKVLSDEIRYIGDR